MSQSAFGRHRGVVRSAVTKWKSQGLLVLDDAGRVKVEETEWNLDQRPATYRGGTTHRPIRATPAEATDPREKPRRAKPSSTAAPADSAPPRPSEGIEELEDDPDGENLPTPAAIRRKENFLGLQRKQQYQSKQGELVDRIAAEALFFEEARNIRDAWLAWPARVAIVMADRLKVDPRLLATVLAEFVRQHLTELGEPSEPEWKESR